MNEKRKWTKRENEWKEKMNEKRKWTKRENERKEKMNEKIKIKTASLSIASGYHTWIGSNAKLFLFRLLFVVQQQQTNSESSMNSI